MDIKSLYVERRRILVCFIGIIVGIIFADKTLLYDLTKDIIIGNRIFIYFFIFVYFMLIYFDKAKYLSKRKRAMLFFTLGFVLTVTTKSELEEAKFIFEKNKGHESFFTGKVYDVKLGEKYTRLYLNTTEDINIVCLVENIHKYEDIHIIGKFIKVKGKKYQSTDDKIENKRQISDKVNKISGILKDVKIYDIKESGSIFLFIKERCLALKLEFFKKLDLKYKFKELAFMKAIAFGYTDDIDKENKKIIQQNGLGHIIATSGMHVAIIYLFLKKINTLIFKRELKAIIIIILFVYCFMCLTPSILRASLTILMYIIAKSTDNRFDLLSCTMAAGIINIFFNPFIIYSVGFQLSYLAMILISNFISLEERFKRDTDMWQLVKLIMFPVIIQLALIPITIFYFNYISLSGFVANIILMELGSGILLVTMFCFLIFLMNMILDINFLFSIFADIGVYMTNIFFNINKFIFSEGSFVITNVKLNEIYIVVFYIAIIYFTSETAHIRYLRKKQMKFD